MISLTPTAAKINSYGSLKFQGNIENYSRDFLKSDFWKKLRTRFYTKPSTIKVCFICGGNMNLQLHHRSYSKLRNNTIGNIICLCSVHHKELHFLNGKHGYPPRHLHFYLKFAYDYHIRTRGAGLYPTHLLKYQPLLVKFAK